MFRLVVVALAVCVAVAQAHVVAHNSTGLECDLCVMVMKQAESWIENNGCTDFAPEAQKLCSLIPGVSGEWVSLCANLVNGACSVLSKYIGQGVTAPNELCSVFKLCPPATNALPAPATRHDALIVNKFAPRFLKYTAGAAPIAVSSGDWKCDLCVTAMTKAEAWIQANGCQDFKPEAQKLCTAVFKNHTLEVNICTDLVNGACAMIDRYIGQGVTAPNKLCSVFHLCKLAPPPHNNSLALPHTAMEQLQTRVFEQRFSTLVDTVITKLMQDKFAALSVAPVGVSSADWKCDLCVGVMTKAETWIQANGCQDFQPEATKLCGDVFKNAAEAKICSELVNGACSMLDRYIGQGITAPNKLCSVFHLCKLAPVPPPALRP